MNFALEALLGVTFAIILDKGLATGTTDKIICEGRSGTIDCSPGTIHIVDAQYGRTAPGDVACPHSSIGTTDCRSDKVASTQGMCEGQQTCSLTSSFSPDPCGGTYKYLNVTYSCNAAETTTIPPTVVTTPATTPEARIIVESKTATSCTDGRRSTTGELRCGAGNQIAVTRLFCLSIDECDFEMRHLSDCPSEDVTLWDSGCVGNRECDILCTGDSCPHYRQSGYLYVEYDCFHYESSGAETTTVATTPLPTTTTSPPTTTTQFTTTPPPTSITVQPPTTTTPPLTTQPTTNGSTSSPAITTDSSPDAVFDSFLSECFGNSSAGEANVKPYRPLTFTSGTDADSRLSVSFKSESLQSKPVKLAISAFSAPSQADGCGSVPDLQSNDTTDDTSDKGDDEESSAAAARAVNGVIDVTVYCFDGTPLQLKDGEYVDIVFPAKINFEEETPVCTSMRGAASNWKWTTDGCYVVYSNYTHVTCRCDHLATVALERGPKGFVVGHLNTVALLLIEKILGSISIICTLVIVMVYFIHGNQHSQLAKIQMNIAMSCCFAHVTYLVGMQATGNLHVCAAMACVLHYLFTVYGTWLVVQTALFLNTCYIHGKTREGLHAALVAPKTYNLELIPLTKTFLGVWGFPVLLVGVLYKEYPYAYGTPESCWLVAAETPYTIFISTVALGLLINVVLTVITAVYFVKIVRRASRGCDDDYEDWIESLKQLVKWCLPTSVVLSAVLIVAWVLHAVYQARSSLALDYLFIIFVMSQGILVFAFYCVFNPLLRTSHQRSVEYKATSEHEKE